MTRIDAVSLADQVLSGEIKPMNGPRFLTTAQQVTVCRELRSAVNENFTLLKALKEAVGDLLEAEGKSRQNTDAGVESFLRRVKERSCAPAPEMCARCGKPWEDHYDPRLLKFKNGAFGTFGLTADHAPYLPSVHAPAPEETQYEEAN